MNKEKNKKILHSILLVLLAVLIVVSIYIKIEFPYINIDELLYTTQFNLGVADMTPVYDGLFRAGPIAVILSALYIVIFNKVKVIKEKKTLVTTLLAVITVILSLVNIGTIDYAKYKIAKSTFFEKNFTNPKDVQITMPEQKKNLVFIFLESFESTLLDENNGGSYNEDLLKEVADINNKEYTTTFMSNNNKLGMKMIDGANHTTASLITNNSSIPFKFQITQRTLNDKHFFNNAYTLGDVLKDNGYKNELISAATSSYGGVKEFFTIHGDYNIIDINTLEENNLEITDKDKIDWGFNDGYMYEVAKKRLDILSKGNEPFNLTLVGIDTHFPRGYRSYYTKDEYGNEYKDVYATESKLLGDFISYLEEQPYFKDTVIVIVGDHETMECDFLEDMPKENRYVYASYINSQAEPTNKENRTYTALDTMPSVLAALGATIENNKLGLGVNLFSDKPTLSETYTLKYLDNELRKTSKLYTNLYYKEKEPNN